MHSILTTSFSTLKSKIENDAQSPCSAGSLGNSMFTPFENVIPVSIGLLVEYIASSSAIDLSLNCGVTTNVYFDCSSNDLLHFTLLIPKSS